MGRHLTVRTPKGVIEEIGGDAAAAPTLCVNAGLAAGPAEVVDGRASAWPADPIRVVVQADQDLRVVAGGTDRRIGLRPCRAGLADTARRPVIAHWTGAVAERALRLPGIRRWAGAAATSTNSTQVGSQAGAGPAQSGSPAQSALPRRPGFGVNSVANALSADSTEVRTQAAAGLASAGRPAESALPRHVDPGVATVAEWAVGGEGLGGADLPAADAGVLWAGGAGGAEHTAVG
ncbi:hypothetical protein TUM20985_38880 [Mycobacterium antarcticum]|nr:hypothetical protein TUM20985_38880 [Mycolicibacterium sp. TUM20985]GLP83088.1 hypothetical protein TUM20984_45080 [Mycolicibacterium sp. TUM20984]